MISFPSSAMPSIETINAAILAGLAIFTGIVLTQADRLSKHQASSVRVRKWLAAPMERGAIPDNLIWFFASLLEDLDACRKFHLNIPSVAFFYVTVDALAFLVDANDPPCLSEGAFTVWIDKFLNPDSGEYVYPGHRLYVARCGLFEELEGGRGHAKRTDAALLKYLHHGPHVIGESPKAEVQVVSIPVLMRDFDAAIKKVVEALQRDEQMLERAKSRWPLARSLRSLVGVSK